MTNDIGPDDDHKARIEKLARILRDERPRNKEVWNELVIAGSGFFERLAKCYTKNDQDADDILQDAFIIAWLKLDRWEPARGPFIPWFIGVIRRCAQGHWRKAGRRRRLQARLEFRLDLTPPIEFEGFATTFAERETVRELLLEMPAQRREVFVLFHGYGMTSSEVASELHLNHSTVRSWLHRDKQRLQELGQKKNREE